MVDKKKLDSIQDSLSGRADKIDFVQAEQNVLFGDISTYARLGRYSNLNGYEHDSFKCYEHSNPSVLLSEMNALNGQEALRFIKYGKLIGSELKPKIEMVRQYRDPTDKASIIGSDVVPLNNINQISEMVRVPASPPISEGLADALGYKQPEPVTHYGLLKYEVESIDFELKNQNPFASSRMVDVTVKFALQTIMALDFLASDGKFRLRDLISFSKGKTVANQQFYGGYSLHLGISYEDPVKVLIHKKPPEYQDQVSTMMDEVPKVNKMWLELELVDYDIGVDENGKASLTLNYVSFIEDYSKKLAFDLFAGKILSKQQISDQINAQNAASSLRQRIAEVEAKLETINNAIESAKKWNDIRAEILTKNTMMDSDGKPTIDFEGIAADTEGLSADINSVNALRPSQVKTELGKLRAEVQSVFSKVHYHKGSDSAGGIQQPDSEDYGLYAYDINAIENLNTVKTAKSSLANNQANLEAKIQEINNRLVFQNKVAKYNLILEYLFENQKVFETTLETKSLVLFSKEYDQAVETYVKNMVNIQNQSSGQGPKQNLQDTLESAQEKIAEIQASTAKEVSMDSKKSEIRTDTTLNDAVKKLAELSKQKKDDAESGSLSENEEIKAIVESRLAGSVNLFPKAGKDYSIYYVYLGDVIDVALKYSGVSEKMRDSKMGVILGSVNMPDPQNPNSTISVNLADIPISLKFLLKFFKKNVVEKDINKYDVTKFLQDIATQLMGPIFVSRSNRFGRSSRDVVQIKNTTFTLYGDGTYDDPSYLGRAIDKSAGGSRFNLDHPRLVTQLKIYHDANKANVQDSNFNRYFYMYGSNELGFSIPSQNLTPGITLEQARATRGVYSFDVGTKNYAINTSFNFKKVKKKYQTEMMAARAMEDGDEYKEIWNHFDLTIEMIGNTIFAPGMHIYSTLNTLGTTYMHQDPFLASHLGLQGYYLVTGVENTIKGRVWRTTVTAKWQSHSALGKGSSQSYNPSDKSATGGNL
tara:strand:- start:3424 stop:6390 length:2967 start_codon:yes stop_codon:yes gene_type:complete